MAAQLLLNLIIAFIWMFLNDDKSFTGFLIGFLLGLLMIGVMRRFWPQDFYLKKLWAVVKLLLLLIKELILSSAAVIKEVIRPRLAMRPGIIALRTELSTDWEITVLSCLICLTPGTLTLDVSRDGNTLYIHAMDIQDAKQLEEQIKGTFEKAIMEVTRS